MSTAPTKNTGNPQKAGWRLAEWCPLVGFSRASIYALPEEHQPHSLYIGAARIITETPQAWLQRMEKVGRARRGQAA